MLVIGIAGADGAGKSTLASHLVSQLAGRFYPVRAPFAHQLRIELQTLMEAEATRYSSTPFNIDLWQKPTPNWLRDLLRGWGDYKRHQDPSYWVKAWEGWLEVLQQRSASQQLLVVADDLRYVNELVAVQHLGGTVLYLDDASVPDHELLHELVEVRSMADLGFTINSKSKLWADPNAVLEALAL